MKLRQLEYIAEVARNGLSVSAAAEHLFTSQPGVSSQIRQIEDELGFPVFVRHGKQLTGITSGGEAILPRIRAILQEVENIQRIAEDFRNPDQGSLAIATTHTQARYALPSVIRTFRERYPKVSLHLHQGTPTQIAEMTASGEADLGIATEALELFEDLVLLPCYRWNRCALVQKNHPLTKQRRLKLEHIAAYPVITYVFGVADRSVINQAFARRKLELQVVLTAADAEVIKTYVRTGLGIGIVARMAYDKDHDADLVALDAGHLFEPSVTSLAIRRNAVLRGFVFEFIELFAPHLIRQTVAEILAAPSRQREQALFDRHVARAAMR